MSEPNKQTGITTSDIRRMLDFIHFIWKKGVGGVGGGILQMRSQRPSLVFEILDVGTLLRAHAMLPSERPTFEDTQASYKHLWSAMHPEVLCSNLLETLFIYFKRKIKK